MADEKVKISDLTQATIINDDDLFVIEQGGVSRSVTGKLLKSLVTGQAQSDYSQNDSTATDYIKNRPCYDGELTVTWDGDPSDSRYIPPGLFMLVDYIPNAEDLVGTSITVCKTDGSTSVHTIQSVMTSEEFAQLAENPDAVIISDYGTYFGASDVDYAIAVNVDELIMISARTDYGALIAACDYSSADGTYTPTAYVSSFTFQALKKLDAKFLPDGIVSTARITAVDVVETDTDVTFTMTLEDGTTTVEKLTFDEDGNPASLTVNNKDVPLTWEVS